MAGFDVDDIHAACLARAIEHGAIPFGNGCRMVGDLVWMTPDLARQWLKKNVNNRNISDLQIRKLKESIRDDGYKLTHQGLAFCEDGTLIDGQHRLTVIISLDISCWVWVVFNVPNSSKSNIDHKFRPRSTVVNLKYDGFVVSSRMTAAATAAMEGVRFGLVKQGHSLGSLKKFIEDYREPLQFTIDNLKGRSVDLQWVRGVLCRAYISGCDKERLQLFCELLSFGTSEKLNAATDSSVLRLKNWIVESKKLRASSTGRREAYAKTQNALRSFLNFENVHKLYACYDELFPCPWDPKQ